MKQATTIPGTAKPRKPRAKKTAADTPAAPFSGASSATLLQVDLWSGSSSPDAVSFQPLAAQMISDLVLVTSGELQSCSDTAISASYKSTRQAVAAVRNLCHLVNGFAGAVSVHAEFTLCHSDDLESLENRETVHTEPQRVLLIGAICEAARTIPGLRFRELPPNGKAPRCTTLELLTPPNRERLAAVPLIVKRVPDVAPQKAAEAPPPKLPVRAPTPFAENHPTPKPKQRMQMFAVAGAVAVALIIAVVIILRPSAKPQPAAVVIPAIAQQIPAPNPPVVVAPKPTPPVATPVDLRKKPPAPHEAALKSKPPAPEPAPEPSSTSGIIYSSDEIKHMIATADKLSGDGNYDRAITFYDAVLKRDRKNEAAAEGRRRAVYNRDHH